MIYFNNAATSYPKFPVMIETIHKALSEGLMFCNRDSVDFTKVQQKIFNLRTTLGNLIGAKKSHYICFTYNDTLAINMLIFGQTYQKGDIVLTSTREHNSVTRPLARLEEKYGVKIVYIPFDDSGNLDILALKENLNKYNSIKYAFFTHASNVTGDVIDIESVGKILHDKNIPLFVDSAQSMGIVPIDVEKSFISGLTFAGHKALNGPQGTGGFYIRKEFIKNHELNPILFGGTGNNSSEILNPTVYPDSFEVGTPAIHDLLGLYASINHIENEIGWENYRNRILDLSNYLYEELKNIPNIEIYGNPKKRSSAISFNIKGFSPKDMGIYLGKYNIVCRTGIHCAALAMKDLGIEGSVRLSLGYDNSKEEIKFVIEKLKELTDSP